jgi:hypothetical protein
LDTLRGILLVALLVGMGSVAGATGTESVASEYRVKAVFLFNFTQFVEWPANAFADAEAPFVIAVVGKDPFGAVLDEVIRGERVAKHPLVVERYENLRQVQRCNLLFIARGGGGFDPALAATKGRRILTVSDADESELRGVMIRLVMRDKRVRLRIDANAVKADELTISSKLLRAAELVEGDG